MLYFFISIASLIVIYTFINKRRCINMIEFTLNNYSYTKRWFNKNFFEKHLTYIQEKPIIMDMRILTNTEMFIIPFKDYDVILDNDWEYIDNYIKVIKDIKFKNILLHICYVFRNENYRIILSRDNDLNIFREYEWMLKGVALDFDDDDLHTNITNHDILADLPKVMHEYAGPLGDFYESCNISINPTGFLTMDLNNKILMDTLHYIKIDDGLGNPTIFKYF